MSSRMLNALLWAFIFLLAIVMGSFLAATGYARNLNGEHDNDPNRAWYESRILTPAAQKRFFFKSCCSGADTVHTQFKTNKVNGMDEWWFLNSKNIWERVPEDIIWEGEFSPTGEAIMFAVGGRPVCFFPPEGGM